MSLIVEAKLGQGVVPRKSLNQCHHALPSHIVGLYIQTGDGRVLPQHLSNGQSRRVISVSVCQTEDPDVCVGPQRFSKSDKGFLKSIKRVSSKFFARKIFPIGQFETRSFEKLIN